MKPFKDRSIDFSKPVEVYRNLHKKGRVYSIRQGGLVVAHTDNIVLKDCKLIVQKSGLEKYLQTGIKNVHAWVKGTITNDPILSFGFIIDYNPTKGFVYFLADCIIPVDSVRQLTITKDYYTTCIV